MENLWLVLMYTQYKLRGEILFTNLHASLKILRGKREIEEINADWKDL